MIHLRYGHMYSRIILYITGFLSAIMALLVIFYLHQRFVVESISISNKTSAPIFLVAIDDPLVVISFKESSLTPIEPGKSERFSYSPKAGGSKDIHFQIRYGAKENGSPQKRANCFSPGSGLMSIEVYSDEVLCK